MTVDWTKPIRFRDDPRSVRVLATDLKGEWAVAVAFLQMDGGEGILTLRTDGTSSLASMSIINVPEEPEVRDVFVTLSPYANCAFVSLKVAMEYTAKYGPATIHQLRLVDDGAVHFLPPDDEGSS